MADRFKTTVLDLKSSLTKMKQYKITDTPILHEDLLELECIDYVLVINCALCT